MTVVVPPAGGNCGNFSFATDILSSPQYLLASQTCMAALVRAGMRTGVPGIDGWVACADRASYAESCHACAGRFF